MGQGGSGRLDGEGWNDKRGPMRHTKAAAQIKSTDSVQAQMAAYSPTLLMACPEGHSLVAIGAALAGEGWDIRIVSTTGPAEGSQLAIPPVVKLQGSAETAVDGQLNASQLLAAARSIQPDVLVVAGVDEDAWALMAVRGLRSDPLTHDMGIVVFPCVSVPEDLDITPMSGPDSWVFLDARPAQAMEAIRKTVRAALDNRLEWAQRDWTPDERRRQAIRTLRLRVERGRRVDPGQMAEMLYGPGRRVDIRVWDGPSPHLPGWRVGADERYGRPILVRHKEVAGDDDELGEQYFTLCSRSGRLLIAAAHVLAELAGGWPYIE